MKPGDGITPVRLLRDGVDTEDLLAVEEPLEIRLDGRPLAVLMRTPGADPEEDLNLVAGFLATEGVIDGLDDLMALAHCPDPLRPDRSNVVLATLAPGVRAAADRFERARRDLYAASSCGLCGKASIDRVFQSAPPLAERAEVPAARIAALVERLGRVQPRFAATGGLHGAALFTKNGDLLAAAEDIGRHNAVDKIIGARLRQDQFPLTDHLLVVSCRAGFEIVQKALVARIAAVIAVGAASSLADTLAREGRLALYSFVRDGRFNAHR
ncbi:MAG: formate dehydrogenase accessory sulfurtransferase FdhD [Myxococcales bacterium]|nr:formate dehydrogenase accessory sulfurtransferase FdhD [Myxococcales bacterium]